MLGRQSASGGGDAGAAGPWGAAAADICVTLYRPVGRKELELIQASGWREFPPRLPDQPIVYPVTNDDYAVQIARPC